MLPTYYGSWDYWELYHKVTFDGPNKLIYINEGETEIDVEIELYSDWKEWSLVRDNLKYEAAMRVVGGDPTPTGFLGATFFLINGWRILLDNQSVNFTGNLYSDDYDSPYTVAQGTSLSTNTVSNLIDKIPPDETNNASIFI
jgi:hypothetical protein